jgi:thiamine pyrophosphokinase
VEQTSHGRPDLGDLAPDSSGGVRCVWVISGAPFAGGLPPLDNVPEPDRVIAADGGAALAAALGLMPDILVGDFDSIDPRLLEEWQEAGVECRRYDHDRKQETDTELAALAALEWNPALICILGAIGGRLDHTLANVLLLTHPALSNTEVRIIEGKQEISLVRPDKWNPIKGKPGDIVSLLPLGTDALGVTLRGMAYPLAGETLLEARGRGVSNVIASEGAALFLKSGRLLMVISPPEIP